MKKRFLSITLILCMLLSIVPLTPVVATAASSPSGVELKMDGTTLKYGGDNVEETTAAGLQVTFDPDNEEYGKATVHGYVLNGGTYYLNSDVTIDKPLIIKGTSTNPTILDLNGHVLKKTGDTGSVIVVADSAYFVLQDTVTNEITYTYTEDNTTKAWTGVTKTTGTGANAITLTGGVITGGTGTKCSDDVFYGGGVFVGSTANFEMTGGNIVGCTVTSTGNYASAQGGGVFVGAGKSDTSTTKFTMTGGSIVGCVATGNLTVQGGGVFVREYTELTMSNARIANCTATGSGSIDHGGGVYNNSKFTMGNGSTIENCTAKEGGGVYSSGTFTMNNGTIKGCTATYTGDRDSQFASGGGVCLVTGNFNMTGGTIENCTATGSGSNGGGARGGGVYIANSSATFTMTGGTIKSCTAKGTGAKGDGVYIYSTMDARGGSVHGVVFVESSQRLMNTSATGSTIFYGSSGFGYEGSATPIICGYRVEFMKDGMPYAQTLAGVDGNAHRSDAKISEPVAPTAVAGKHFAGWSYKKADNGGTEMWNFGESFNDNNPKCDSDTDRPNTEANESTRMKVTLTAEWHTLEKVDAKAATCTETGNGQYWKCTDASCGKLFADNKGENATTIDAVTTAIDSNNHAGTLGEWQKDENSHWKTYSCCTTVKGAEGTHNFGMNDKCECGAVQYTVTFDPNGGTVDPTSATTDVEGKMTSLPIPERNGCRFTGWYTDKTGGTEVTETTVFIAHTTIYAHWNDYTAPTGEIKLGKNSWKNFLNNITFGLFFKDTQEVTITATDNDGEDVKIEYLLSDKELTAEELATVTFTAYNDKFTVEPNNEYVIYAKLSDNTGNVAYINSNGIVLDNIAPVITGITNGETYCAAQTVTVSDKYDVTVTVNGTPITLDANGQFTLSPASGTQSVVATDKAGNVSVEMIVTVNDGHEGGTATCTKKAVCKHCGLEYGDLDPTNHEKESDEWTTKNETQHKKEWTCCHTVTVELENHEWNENGVCTECGYGCIHSGGVATCKSKAKCTHCGNEYGEVDVTNHTTLKHIEAKAATTEAEGNIEYWHCEDCGKYFSDKDCKNEITLADTVIAKLSDSKAPQTGDNSHMALWFTLLFVSGGLLTVTGVYGKKKKYSAK